MIVSTKPTFLPTFSAVPDNVTMAAFFWQAFAIITTTVRHLAATAVIRRDDGQCMPTENDSFVKCVCAERIVDGRNRPINFYIEIVSMLCTVSALCLCELPDTHKLPIH
jgi:hypothetical protein